MDLGRTPPNRKSVNSLKKQARKLRLQGVKEGRSDEEICESILERLRCWMIEKRLDGRGLSAPKMREYIAGCIESRDRDHSARFKASFHDVHRMPQLASQKPEVGFQNR